MKRQYLSIATFVLVFSVVGFSQSDSDSAQIKQAALNCAEDWYEGNADKMENSLHPMHAKRIANSDEKGGGRLDELSALGLVQGTRSGFGM